MPDSTKQAGGDRGVRAVSLTLAAALGGGDMLALPVGQPFYNGVIAWDVQFDIAPDVAVVDLELCNGDPTVAANWFQADTNNALVNYRRTKSADAALWARLNLKTKPTNGAKVSGGITVQ